MVSLLLLFQFSCFMFDFLRFTNFFVLFIRPLKLSLRMATLTHKRPIRPIIASDPKKEKQVCFFCWRRFPYQSALRDHLKTHVVDSRECFCYECNPEQAVAHVEDIYMRYLDIQPKDIDRTSTTYLNRLHHKHFILHRRNKSTVQLGW